MLERREGERDAKGRRDGRDDGSGREGCEMVVDERRGQRGLAEGVFFERGCEPGGFHVEHAVGGDEGAEGMCGLGEGGLNGEVGSCFVCLGRR